MAANFDHYLSVKSENIENVKALPVGHYFATITGWKTKETDFKQGKGPQPMLEISLKTDGPSDDVEESDLPANGGQGVLISKDFEFASVGNDGKTEGGAAAQMRKLADQLDLDVTGLELRDILDALKGQQVLAYNEPRADKSDPEVTYTNIKKLLAPN